MEEEMADLDRVAGGKIRKELREWILIGKLAPLSEKDDRRAREGLRDRGDAEEGPCLHRRAQLEIRHAVGPLNDRPLPSGHEDDAAELAGGDERPEVGVDPLGKVRLLALSDQGGPDEKERRD